MITSAGLLCYWLTVKWIGVLDVTGVTADFVQCAGHVTVVALPPLNGHCGDTPVSLPLQHPQSAVTSWRLLLLFVSVGFGNVSIHVEVPGDFGQGELNTVKLSSEDDLASQPGVLLKHGCHVQHVILPRMWNYLLTCSMISLSHPHKKNVYIKIIK